MDKKEALEQIKTGDFFLAAADDKLKGDKEVFLAVVKYDANALEHADSSLKKDKEVVLEAKNN